ncbi:prephenate dehydratase [Mycobacterium sp. CBMA271]|uniref:prephenate dehydratase n=1 Tax=unclassified Mycobacteroides TaxID=2618759 RepID=UPI0013225B57|nr:MULTISPECIES: prephenate dehydratase [unclassified Mycobacteroides]MUM18044.1 prephenate dehydratase [Mycobacteroides sp. CBMA 326]MUM23475.1 prephenate dehydratase [Mycobacteroides sp. CBMA 271]
MQRITYLGPEGTFSEAALTKLRTTGQIPGSADVESVPAGSPRDALVQVQEGAARYACVPIESSLEGRVVPTLDTLAAGEPLQVFAETVLPVSFTIAVRPGITADAVKTVAAFPIAAAQVREWLATHLPNAELVPANSNAAAAEDVKAQRADAGVSTAWAAQRLGLDALANGVVDEANAHTRFVLVGQPGPPPAATGSDRTSMVLALRNVPGALAGALNEFAIRDIDLTFIESRPTRTGLGVYRFFLDCVGHIDDIAVSEALKGLHRRCEDVRYLGSWPRGTTATGGANPPELDEASGWLSETREGKLR